MVSRWGSVGDGELDAVADDIKADSPAKDEIISVRREIEAVENAFDQYIDPDGNEDVDIEEWRLGLQKLNV